MEKPVGVVAPKRAGKWRLWSACGLVAVCAGTRIALAAPLVLEAGSLRAEFDARAVLTSLTLSGGPQLLATAPDAVALRFGIGCPAEQGPPRMLEFGSDKARSIRGEPLPPAADGTQSARFHFADFAVDGAPAGLTGLTAWFTASLRPGEAALLLRVGAEVTEPLRLEYVQGPGAAVAIGPDSRLVTGVAKGGDYPALTDWKEGASISASHPGNLAAQFGAVYGPGAGVVSYSRDTAGWPKGLSARRAGASLQLAWRQAACASGRWEPPFDIVFCPVPTAAAGPLTWRHAADIYGQWARSQPWCASRYADRPDIPDWMKAGPAMVRFSRSWLARPESVGRWLREYWQPLHGAEIPLVVAFWGWEHVESWVAPAYLPPYPSAEAFAAVMRDVRAANGQGFLWPSGYHWTVSFDSRAEGTFQWDDRARWEAEGKAHTVVNRDGSLAVSSRPWLRGGQNASLCPGDPWTRNWFDRIALDCLSTGATMVQVDQVVCGAFPTCFSREHGHPVGPGLWKAEVFTQQLQSLATKCRTVCPETVLGFEEPQELFNHLVGIQDYRDLEVAWRHLPAPEPASVFAYLYHEYLPVFQSNPHGGDLVTQGYCLVNGQMPHLVPLARFGRGPLLVNGGFDEPATGVPPGWDKVGGYKGEVWTGSCALDTEVRHGGVASLRLENTGESTVQVSQNVSIGRGGITPGVPYRLRVWLRSERLARPNTVSLAALTHDLGSKGGWRIPFPAADGQWHEGSASFTVPDDAQFLRLMLHVAGDARVWVDDVSILDDASGALVEVQAEPADHELTRQWVRLFHGEGRPYLQYGRMLHPPALQTDTIPHAGRTVPAILHNAFRAADGSEAVVLANVTNGERTGTLHWRGQERVVKLAPQAAVLLR